MRSSVPSYNKKARPLWETDNMTQHSCTLKDTSPLFRKPTYKQYSKSSLLQPLPTDEALVHPHNQAAELAS